MCDAVNTVIYYVSINRTTCISSVSKNYEKIVKKLENFLVNLVFYFVEVPQLYMIETIDTIKLATNVNTVWGKKKKEHSLKVMVQVNTSDEPRKILDGFECSIIKESFIYNNKTKKIMVYHSLPC